MPHVFISYVREDRKQVDRLCKDLSEADVDVWLDRAKIRLGERWRQAIRLAIESGAFFLACFSKEYEQRARTYMNEELTLAIDVLRQTPSDRVWFIPLLLSDCEVPDRDIGGGESLKDFQWVNMSHGWQAGVRRLLEVVKDDVKDPDVMRAAKSKSSFSEKSLFIKSQRDSVAADRRSLSRTTTKLRGPYDVYLRDSERRPKAAVLSAWEFTKTLPARYINTLGDAEGILNESLQRQLEIAEEKRLIGPKDHARLHELSKRIAAVEKRPSKEISQAEAEGDIRQMASIMEGVREIAFGRFWGRNC